MHALLNSLKIAFDNGDGDISFVSHAHSDHLNGVRKKEKIIASDETFALADLSAENVLPIGVKLFDAGHILGARQIKIDSDGSSIVYTGDLCMRPSLTTKGAEIVQCDKLIIEGTYADPFYKFPDYYEVCDNIARWVKENDSANIIIGCYELGKAQELVKLLNDYCGIAPIVREKADDFCSVYEDFGIKLDRVCIGTDEAEEVMKKRFVALVPMRHGKRYFAARLAEAFERKTLAAVATGWAMRMRFDVDMSFPLSDHLDHYDMKDYIIQSNAKEVEFFCGDGSALLKSIRYRNNIPNSLHGSSQLLVS